MPKHETYDVSYSLLYLFCFVCNLCVCVCVCVCFTILISFYYTRDLYVKKAPHYITSSCHYMTLLDIILDFALTLGDEFKKEVFL